MDKSGENKRVCAVILAGGVGSRMGANVTKQKMLLLGKSVIYRTVRAFEECPEVTDITVVVREEETDFAREELSGFSKVRRFVTGGKTRAESARAGFEASFAECDYVAVHDGARCLVTPEMIGSVIREALKYGAASAVGAIYDTLKLTDGDGMIISTADRRVLFRASTPQVFEASLYRRALDGYGGEFEPTDDNMLLENIGVAVKAVDIGGENIKITTMDDFRYAEFLLKERERNV